MSYKVCLTIEIKESLSEEILTEVQVAKLPQLTPHEAKAIDRGRS